MQLPRVCPQAPLLLWPGRGAARAGADGAGRDTPATAQQCLHTHLARARTQITLIHFKPTLSPAALQQILLKACLHNGRAAQLAQPAVPGASETLIIRVIRARSQEPGSQALPAPGVETPSEPGKPGLEPQPGKAERRESAGDKAWGRKEGRRE